MVERKKKRAAGAAVPAQRPRQDGVGNALAQFKAELVPLDDLKPHPRNYRQHPDELEHLAQSIREHGVYRNVVTAKDGTILAGHGVVLACRKLGLKKIPVIRTGLKADDPRALKLLVGDNEIAHLSEQDDRMLADMLKDLKSLDPDGLFGTGWDDMMLAGFAMVTRGRGELADFDAAAEWAGMPEFSGTGPVFSLVFLCEAAEERDGLAKKFGLDDKFIRKQGKAWTMRWPPREKDDPSSLRVEQAAP